MAQPYCSLRYTGDWMSLIRIILQGRSRKREKLCFKTKSEFLPHSFGNAAAMGKDAKSILFRKVTPLPPQKKPQGIIKRNLERYCISLSFVESIIR